MLKKISQTFRHNYTEFIQENLKEHETDRVSRKTPSYFNKSWMMWEVGLSTLYGHNSCRKEVAIIMFSIDIISKRTEEIWWIANIQGVLFLHFFQIIQNTAFRKPSKLTKDLRKISESEKNRTTNISPYRMKDQWQRICKRSRFISYTRHLNDTFLKV